MIIVVLLFFKSICLYCQRLVLYVHDRWINPKNVRLLKEAAEAKGSKFEIKEYRQVKKSKKRRYVSSSSTSAHSSTSLLSNSLADSDNCRFCANTPQGYCRHHFHLQELHVQKQQRQKKFWCPLSGVVAGTNRLPEYRQLRKIKRELKRNIQQNQLKSAKPSITVYEYSSQTNNYPPSSSTASTTHQHNSENSSYFNNDSGYQTISLNTTSPSLESEENSDLQQKKLQSDLSSVVTSNSCYDYVDIETPSSSTSFVETTYSFKTCYETPCRSPSPIPKTTTSYNSFVSCEYTALSTTYL